VRTPGRGAPRHAPYMLWRPKADRPLSTHSRRYKGPTGRRSQDCPQATSSPEKYVTYRHATMTRTPARRSLRITSSPSFLVIFQHARPRHDRRASTAAPAMTYWRCWSEKCWAAVRISRTLRCSDELSYTVLLPASAKQPSATAPITHIRSVAATHAHRRIRMFVPLGSTSVQPKLTR